MLYSLVSDDAFLELGIAQAKAEVALHCIIDDSECTHAQTLADIASDYLSAMGGMIQAMQENMFKVPQEL